MNVTRRGTLIIADISGYTRYLVGVELEHSQDILAELVASVVETMRGSFILAKLAGDAVFCYDTRPEPDGQTALATMQATYAGFRQRLRTIQIMSSCPCDACRSVGGLDLKFVAHYGTFLVHDVAGSIELVGPDVIGVHRLLKNDIIAATGIEAYAFLTEALLRAGNIDGLTEPRHTESTDVGEFTGAVIDLAHRLQRSEQERSVYLEQDDAFAQRSVEIPGVPPALAWELAASGTNRVLWMGSLVRSDEELSGGERRAGARNHCVHATPMGDLEVYHEIVDWKPFRYFTEHTHGPAGDTIDMWEFDEPSLGVTRVTLRIATAPGTTASGMLEGATADLLDSLDGLAQLARERVAADTEQG